MKEVMLGHPLDHWMYAEQKHCGVDYSNKELAERYDQQHQQFRNYAQEFQEMLTFLSLQNTQEMTLLDLGCGTGATLPYASKAFKTIYAVDISEPMLAQAKQALGQEQGRNVRFVQAGFLSYRHRAEPVDVVITKAALHHLPDFWKQIALCNINSMLKPGGLLYIFDVVFHFHPSEYSEKINAWIQEFESKAGKAFTQEVEIHIREEYSTFHWILAGLLHKAGFTIEQMRTRDGFLTEYHCTKTSGMNIAPHPSEGGGAAKPRFSSRKP